MEIETLPEFRFDALIVLTFLVERILEELNCPEDLIPGIWPNISFLNHSVKFTGKFLESVAHSLGIVSAMIANNDTTLQIPPDSRLKADARGALQIAASALSLHRKNFIPDDYDPTNILHRISTNFDEFIVDVKIWNPHFLGEEGDILNDKGEDVHLTRLQFKSLQSRIHKAMGALNSAKESMPELVLTPENEILYTIKAVHFLRIARGLSRVYMSVMHFQLMGDRNPKLNKVLKHTGTAFEIIESIKDQDEKDLPSPRDVFPRPYACYNQLLAMYILYLSVAKPVPEATMDVPSDQV